MMQKIPNEIPISERAVRSLFTINSWMVSRKELANIFSDGNIQVRRQAYDIITAIDPSNRSTYEKIIQN